MHLWFTEYFVLSYSIDIVLIHHPGVEIDSKIEEKIIPKEEVTLVVNIYRTDASVGTANKPLNDSDQTVFIDYLIIANLSKLFDI